jgi:transposase
MAQNGMADKVMTTPASSPDLNPIENVWASMKYYLQTVAKPRTKDQLVQGIKCFWDSLTKQQCGRYIVHIHKVIPYVVLNDGEASGF